MKRLSPIRLILIVSLSCWVAPRAEALTWDQVRRQNSEWFAAPGGEQAVDNVLRMQLPCGGWDKNIEGRLDMTAQLPDAMLRQLERRVDRGTIDNGATYSQLRFLARAHAATQDERARDAFYKGLEYLLAAQYDNGGWPMYYPLRPGYYTHIHFNDNGMSGVMDLLRDVADGDRPFDFVDAERRRQAAAAVARGIECILACQVVVDGRRTAWCAQHDEVTLAPASARAYEPVSLSGHESVALVRQLMRVERPSDEIIDAVRGAVAWFEAVQIAAVRVKNVETSAGRDRIVVHDPQAAPIWARFYEIGSNRPLFIGRDAVLRDRFDQIERERRVGYSYYGNWPARLLSEEYPAWAAQWEADTR